MPVRTPSTAKHQIDTNCSNPVHSTDHINGGGQRVNAEKWQVSPENKWTDPRSPNQHSAEAKEVRLKEKIS
jgi:hypothetical protein